MAAANRSSNDSGVLERTVLGLRGWTWQLLPERERHRVLEGCFRYWRRRGFPYYRLTEPQIVRVCHNLAGKPKECILLGDEIQMSMTGLDVANHFHPQMWSVPIEGAHSPLERFHDDQVLRRVLRRCLQVWPTRFSVNESNLRRMLTTFSRTARVSNFRPTAAKALYEHYSRPGDAVVDFAAGYGGRLLGCCSLDRTYIGIDPCLAQIRGLHAMMATLDRLGQARAQVRIVLGCAEEELASLPGGSFPLVFSSPPYFDYERYSNEPTQSYLRYPRYEQWVQGFLGWVIAESARVLNAGGHLLLNVADVHGLPLIRDAHQLAARHFDLVAVWKLRLGHKPY